ncbi:NADH-quinone oxidoreductase subunit NuoG [Elongatibacter sediminis]|uniref:NADH-quinone oxidoreductase n=1 Tax=Elongatibacter sediminis TaxID=3119006 RepID=A0AAW9RFD3_9GAMM
MSAEAKEVKPAVEMVNIEVNGVPMEAPKGSMIIEATDKAGISIPRFCYHRKLSIAANCRMCLVDVEKAPKPMPACATPVMEGMKVYTESRRAIDAQHGVMEFLLINHPLDCPICDQGGECELQDLAMGYGRSVSRFTERKRVVKDKNVGPLVQTDMTRCIHCTRCIRFLDEIAGTVEMGGTGRGDRLEIGTCVENSIDSELSGNIIDLCPVGALTNKPFRFSARAWEMAARPSVGAHDGVGSHLYYHARTGRIMRAVPRDSEATNETWLADRDRYSHFGLYHEDRVIQPLIKVDGQWRESTWDDALARAVEILKNAGKDLCTLMSPSAATEEYYLAQRLVRALGSAHIDHRLRECDFADDGMRPSAPLFQTHIAGLESTDAALLVGCNPRHEAPILGHRLRKAWRAGATISVINPLKWDFVFDVEHQQVVAPQQMVGELAAVCVAAAGETGVPDALTELVAGVEPTDAHRALADRLRGAEQGVILVGHFAAGHEQAASLRQLAGWLAELTDCGIDILPHGANATGAWLAGAVPHRGPGGRPVEAGMTVADMLGSEGNSWLLWDFEPGHDVSDPAAAQGALANAAGVVAVAAYAGDDLKSVADVILPLAPVAESEGSFINVDGLPVPFAPAGRVSGDARPGWKILRRLGDALGLEGFGQVSLANLQAEMRADIDAGTAQAVAPASVVLSAARAGDNGLFRIGEVPMYAVDALCRRSAPLQQTVHAESDFVGLNPADADRLGLTHDGKARVRQGTAFVELPVRVTDQVPSGGAWVRSATEFGRTLGPASGPIKVEVA